MQKSIHEALLTISCLLFIILPTFAETLQEHNIPDFNAWKKWTGFPVVDIQYKCDGDFPKDKVKSAVTIQIGSPYSRSEIRNSIENIYSLGNFSEVKVDAQSKGNGVLLTFIMTNQVRTKSVQLVGNKKLSRDRIAQVMKLKPGESGQEYDDSIAQADAVSITKLYSANGFFNAGVSFSKDLDSETKRVNVTFSIVEDYQPVITEVIFTGTNRAIIAPENLLKEMKNVKRKGSYKGQQSLDSDARRIEELYRERGYLTAKVTNIFATSDTNVIKEYAGKGEQFKADDVQPEDMKGGSVVVIIEIEQGKKVYIEIDGNRNLKDKEILKAIQRMRSITDSSIRRAKDDIEQLYRSKGYYLAKVSTSVLSDRVWDFNTSTGGWEPIGGYNEFAVANGVLKASSNESLAMQITEQIRTGVYQKLLIRMKLSAIDNSKPDSSAVGGIYWVTDESKKWNQKKSREIKPEVILDNQFHEYEAMLYGYKHWSDIVTKLRFVPADISGANVEIDWLKLVTEYIPIVFDVTENKQMRIKEEVRIEAVKGKKLHMEKEDIRKQMLTRKKSFWSFWKLKNYFPSGILDEVVLQQDLRAIIAFYRDNGYTSPAVESKKIPKPEEGEIEVVITIDEGPRTYMTEIILEGNSEDVLSSKAMLSNPKIVPNFKKENMVKEGNRNRYKLEPPIIYREDEIVAVRSLLRSWYADKGYLARIEPSRQFSQDFTEVSITYRITEGEQIKIDDDIEIRGNLKTKPKVIKRELSDRLTEDRILSYTEIAKSWQRIYDLGFFENVKIDTQPIGGSDDLVKMIINVKERNSRTVNMHGGYSSLEGFKGGIEASDINLFGTGRRLSGKALIGTQGQRLEMEFVEPRLLGTTARGLINPYPYLEYSKDNYWEIRKGITTGISWDFYRKNTIKLDYRYDVLEYSLEDNRELTKIGRIEMMLQRDTRNNVLNPEKGFFSGLTLEYANPKLGGFENFRKVTLNNMYYTKLFWNFVLALGFRTGSAWGLGDTGRILTPELFRMKDYPTPRGYEWKTGGSGSVMINTSAEIRFPIFKWIGSAVFFDSGRMYDSFSDFDIRSMKSAVGVGLRITTPIGPVRLDYGYPIRGNGDRRRLPNIAFGHPF